MRRMTVDEIPAATRYVARKRADRDAAHYERVTFALFAFAIGTMVAGLAYLMP